MSGAATPYYVDAPGPDSTMVRHAVILPHEVVHNMNSNGDLSKHFLDEARACQAQSPPLRKRFLP